MSPPEHRYRIYKVEQGEYGKLLRVERSFYTYGEATDEDIVAELKGESSGEYVVYPYAACKEFTVNALVEQTVRNGERVGPRDNRFVQ